MRYVSQYSTPTKDALSLYQREATGENFRRLLETLDGIFSFTPEKPVPNNQRIESYYRGYYFHARKDFEKDKESNEDQAKAIFLERIDRIVRFGDYPRNIVCKLSNGVSLGQLISRSEISPKDDGQVLPVISNTPNGISYDLRRLDLRQLGPLTPTNKTRILHLEGSDLSGVTFNGDGLGSYKFLFHGADLRDADLSRISHLRSGDLIGARLAGVILPENFGSKEDLRELCKKYPGNPSDLYPFVESMFYAVLASSIIDESILKETKAGLQDTYLHTLLHDQNPENSMRASQVVTSLSYAVRVLAKELDLPKETQEKLFCSLFRSIDKSNFSGVHGNLAAFEASHYRDLVDPLLYIFSTLMYPELVANLDRESLLGLDKGKIQAKILPLFLEKIIDEGVRLDQILRLSDLWHKGDFDPMIKEVQFYEDSWKGILDEESHTSQRVNFDNFSILCLIDFEQFRQESNALGHCIGRAISYRNKAKAGTGHYFSVRDNEDSPLSTMEFELVDQESQGRNTVKDSKLIKIPDSKQVLVLKQHQGRGNKDLALGKLKEGIESGDIKLSLSNFGKITRTKAGADDVVSEIEKETGLDSKSLQLVLDRSGNPELIKGRKKAQAQERAWTVFARPESEFLPDDAAILAAGDLNASRKALSDEETRTIQSTRGTIGSSLEYDLHRSPGKTSLIPGRIISPIEYMLSAKGPGGMFISNRGRDRSFIPAKYRDGGLDKFMESTGLRELLWKAVEEQLREQQPA